MVPPDGEWRAGLRRRALIALALNRTPGLHFIGNYLGLVIARRAPDDTRITLADGAHCRRSDGAVHPAVVALVADIAAATAVRARLDPAQRLGTVSLQLQYCATEARGDLAARGVFRGFLTGTRGRLGLADVVLEAGGAGVLRGQGAFMVLDALPGQTMHAPQSAHHDGVAPLAEDSLTPPERRLLARFTTSVAAAAEPGAVLDTLWQFTPHATTERAHCRIANDALVGNRVGHMQGGLQLGLALATAAAALPAGWLATGISAAYVGPGDGRKVTARAGIVHRGRQTAVVRTELVTGRGRRVLEAMSTHAAPAA